MIPNDVVYHSGDGTHCDIADQTAKAPQPRASFLFSKWRSFKKNPCGARVSALQFGIKSRTRRTQHHLRRWGGTESAGSLQLRGGHGEEEDKCGHQGGAHVGDSRAAAQGTQGAYAKVRVRRRRKKVQPFLAIFGQSDNTTRLRVCPNIKR